MQKPDGLAAPGLVWRRQKNRMIAYWVARPDITKRGYLPRTRRLGVATGDLSPDEWASLASQCELLQAEMLNWARGGIGGDPRSLFDGTLGALIEIYLRDPDSSFQALRYHTKHHYESKLAAIRKDVGAAQLSEITFREFKRWHSAFCTEGRMARGHAFMTMLRIVIGFGALLELPNCKRLKDILGDMEFPNPKKRSAFITATHAVAIRDAAHAAGFPSVALAQALQFELMLRQKDVIGEWVPIAEPGISDVQAGPSKWLHGLHWSQIGADMVLRKRISKSLKGRDATATAGQGNVEEFDLRVYPMVMEELQHVASRAGPVVVCEYSGLPWRSKPFQAKWRQIASAAGIPTSVQNRDSRAGGITEATDAIAASSPDFEAVRRHAGHSQPSMTARYSRSHVVAKSELERLRVERRKK